MNRLRRSKKSGRPIKILQFGAGNFLRAYFDWMVDVLNEQTDFNGDVLIIKPTETGDYLSLRQQNGLYHILTNGFKEGELIQDTHLVKCIQEVIHPYNQWDDYIDSAKLESIKLIVSNTTEAGIQFNPHDQYADKPAREFPAKLTQWLYARWSHFNGDPDQACIILPSELIEHNGSRLRECVLQYANHWSLTESFAEWISTHCQFYNTLVDRIVTGYPTERAEQLKKDLGCEDKLMVEAEPYHLFVIEGPRELNAVIPFDKTNLNVVFTDDLQSYRAIKVSLLNGCHTAMVPVGYLAGVRTVKEAIDHPEVGSFIQNVLFKNIIPALDFPEETLLAYAKDVLDRFRNPFIKHHLIDISLNSISKYKTRLLPSFQAYIKKTGHVPEYICHALAALIVFYKAQYKAETIQLRDSVANIDFFENVWARWEVDKDIKKLVDTILSKTDFWETDLSIINELPTSLSEHILHILAQQTVS